MTNLKKTSPSKDTIEEAIRIIQMQGQTPESPGELKQNGKISLCAAAALASAGLELADNLERRRQFEEELIVTHSSEPIRQVFSEFGWSVELCNKTMATNDHFAPSLRSESVTRYLASLSAKHSLPHKTYSV